MYGVVLGRESERESQCKIDRNPDIAIATASQLAHPDFMRRSHVIKTPHCDWPAAALNCAFGHNRAEDFLRALSRNQLHHVHRPFKPKFVPGLSSSLAALCCPFSAAVALASSADC